MSEHSRLRWLCRRGMKELDVVLTGYLEHRYADAPATDQAAFRRLLEMQDPHLYGLILGKETTDDRQLDRVLRVVRGSAGG